MAIRKDVGENVELEEESEGSGKYDLPQDMTLEKIVQLPTWREILLDLVHQNKLDPWNIDVVEISSQYLERVRKIETTDLRLPANLILGAAILLRFKSDALSLEEAQVQETIDTYVEDEGIVGIPSLELRSRIPPKRRITLDELLNAMETVMEESKKREVVQKQITLPANMEIHLNAFKLEEKIEEVMKKIGTNLDEEGWATFSGLLSDKNRQEIVFTLLPLLFLVQEGKIVMMQEKFFGEIFIRIAKEKDEKEKSGA